jgi:positive regulator of sigma E activity
MAIDRSRTFFRILGLCETFLLDAAVLVFVFPILDTLINFGTQRLTFRLIFWTLLITGVFFSGALLMSVLATKREENRL